MEESMTPLSLVNGITNSADVNVTDRRVSAEGVQSTINQWRALLERVTLKRERSEADSTLIANIEKVLSNLTAFKNSLNSTIHSAIPTVQASLIQPEIMPLTAHGYVSQHDFVPQPFASGSNVQIPPAFNAHGRDTDGVDGPVAKADDIEKFLIAAAEQFDGNTSVDKALEKLGLDHQFKPLPGMEVALMPHQTIGVAWMLDKEKGDNKGGCMSDDMGLGKTVQMIAVLVSNRSEDPLCKTNLIVATKALLGQWQLEIETKTNLGFKCLIYHGKNKTRKLEELRSYDIVVTTYNTLAAEWPDDEAEIRLTKQRVKCLSNDEGVIDLNPHDERKSRKKKQDELGLLMQMNWYRVILDEAQNIRTRGNKTSRAVTHLDATYRWCLTGTPIINSLSDAYGLLRFLRIRPWDDWKKFNGHIGRLERKRPDEASKRLQAVFSSMLLRRKKDSMLDGKRLIDLPVKDVALTKLEFSQEERDIYKMVELKSQAIFNRYLKAGTVLRNYHQVIVLLLRLRQVCTHPSLIQEDSAAYVAAKDLNDRNYDKHYELSRARQLVSPEFVENMLTKMKQTVLQRMAAERESADAAIDGEECPICRDIFTHPVVTPCGHFFCKQCICHLFRGESAESGREQLQYKKNERPCPVCRGAIMEHKLFPRDAFEPSDQELGLAEGIENDDVEMADVSEVVDDYSSVKRIPKKRRASNLDEGMKNLTVEDGEDEDGKGVRWALKKRRGKRRAIVISDDDANADIDDIICGAKPDTDSSPDQVKLTAQFLPSTKMKHMMESLRAWAVSHPDEKTLVISQWTSCLQLVSGYLEENGFKHVKYQGDMSRDKREHAVHVFMFKDQAKIMLMSLKCGGVGLNLTRANRVISLDLGWSEAVESQAFDRVHRLGQTRPVYVHRLVIADTVEDRILTLQEKKKTLADVSLGEGVGKKIGKMDVKQLAMLFGLDAKGRLLSQ